MIKGALTWSDIASLVETIIMIVGFVMAVKEYCTAKKYKTKRKLIEQIVAYYSEEQEAIKWINDLSQDKIPSLQQKLRERARNNDNNPEKVYHNMTAKQAMDLINRA
jgi:predicted RNase H-related nuclease YkuK (DUF458 family)